MLDKSTGLSDRLAPRTCADCSGLSDGSDGYVHAPTCPVVRAVGAQLLDDLRRLAVERRTFSRALTEADRSAIEVTIGIRPPMIELPSWTAEVRRCLTGVRRTYRRHDVPICAMIDLGDPFTGEVVA